MQKRIMVRICSLLLGTSMVLSMVACGSATNSNEPVSVESSTVEESISDTSVSEENPVEIKEKVAVDDYYEYVNADWFALNELKSNESAKTKMESLTPDYIEAVDALFKGKNPEDFEDNAGMQKMLAIYQMAETECAEGINYNDKVKALVDEIMSAKNIDGIYSLLERDEYLDASWFFRIYYGVSDAEYFVPEIYGLPMYSIYSGLTEEENAIITEGVFAALEKLGYDSKEASRIAENFIASNTALTNFYSNAGSNTITLNPEAENLCPETSKRILNMMGNNGYLLEEDVYHKLILRVWIDEGYLKFLDSYMSNENLQMVKDALAVHTVSKYKSMLGDECQEEFERTSAKISGAVTFERERPYTPLDYVLNMDMGIVGNYCADTMFSKEVMDCIDETFKLVQDETASLIKETSFLNSKENEKLRIKAKTIKLLKGSYPVCDALSDVELADNLFDNNVMVNAHHIHFLQENYLGCKKDVMPDEDMFSINAYFERQTNYVILTDAAIAAYVTEDIPFEVALATYGQLLAHEIGHAFDTRGIVCRPTGAYEEPLTEDEHWEMYWNLLNGIYYDLDGKISANGNDLNANMVVDETFADLLAITVCLRILEDRDDADYDLFFRSYADYFAAVLTPKCENLQVRSDHHLPFRERVNYVLYKFEKFYEIYDVSEDAEFYVEPEKRLKIRAISNQ